MNTFSTPVHSTATLVKASVVAILIAAVVLVTCILPSEYNIDPTGLGKTLGLTELALAAGDQKSKTPVIDRQLTPSLSAVAERSDTVNIEIPAGKGLEYKLLMDKYAHVEYEWNTDSAALYFDFHGEPKGDTSGYFESYSITTSNQMKGSLTTPFTGSHGWYWKNNTDTVVIVTLSMKGSYTLKG